MRTVCYLKVTHRPENECDGVREGWPGNLDTDGAEAATVSRYDAVVVGCGAMGSSVSYNLASRGMKVLTIDKFPLNHDRGSSYGRSRIIRLTYYEDDRYVPLLRRAFESWRELERRTGKKLMTVTGGLMVGKVDGELVSGVLRSARVHGLRHSLMSSRESNERFGALSLDEELVAVYEETAGVLFPEACISAFVESARQAGGRFEFSAGVTGWRSGKERVEIEAGGERIDADRVVLCAGPWMGQLLAGLIPLRCERQVPMWFPSGGRAEFMPDRLPVFIFEEPSGELYYGIPELGDGVKVARTHGGETVEPDSVDRTVTEKDVGPVKAFIERRMNGLGTTPTGSTTCIYTNTPDLNFAIGTHPKDGRVTIVSACSGHGFKFASVLGEVGADIALGVKPGFDLSFLDLRRFL